METQASAFFGSLSRSASITRLESYRAGGSYRDALCKYLWNIALCESLYPSFQVLEVAFRNAAHIEIGTVTFPAIGTTDWLMSDPQFLKDSEKSILTKARESVRERRGSVTEHLLVGELPFGFWTSLLDSRYDAMWPKIIKGVFPHTPRSVRTRGNMSAKMNAIRKLRNAALHHHSIWHWSDLQSKHRDMHELIGWICPASERVAKATDRFPAVFGGGFSAFTPIVDSLPN